MKIISIIIRYFLFAFFLLVAGLGYFFTLTTPGLQLAVEIAKQSIPGVLHIQRYEGSLFTGFSLKNITYTDAQQSTQIESIHIDWKPKQLLHYKITFDDISIRHVRINFNDAQQSSQDHDELPSLNFLSALVLKRLDIQDVLINGTFKHFPIKGSVNILFENNTLKMDNTQLQIANSIMTFKGTLKKQWDIQWQMRVPNVRTWVPALDGVLTGFGTITGNFNSPLFNTTLEAKNLSYEKQTLRLLKLTGTTKLAGANAFSQFQLWVNNSHNQVTGHFTFPQLNGLLNLRFTDFSTFIPPSPYAKHLRGLLTAQIKLSGTLEDPHWSGDISLANGHIKSTKFGIKINDLNLKARIEDTHPIPFNGRFRAGKGIATFQGDADLASLALKMSLKGDNLKIMNTLEYKILVSPDLTLLVNAQETLLTGHVLIPYADIKPNAFSTTVTLPSDVVFVGQPQQTHTDLSTHLSLQIKVKLGDEIHFSNTDLEANLAGKLFISQTPGSPMTASGELYTLKGTGIYHAYGQKLTLQQGRLIYTGNSISNPGLDIRAMKTIKTTSTMQSTYTGTDQIHVGVEVSGTVSHPVVALISDAGLSTEDILSYLLFGYPKSQISGASSLNLLSVASSSLHEGGTSQIGNMTQKLQDALGLTELTTESTEIFNPNTNMLETTTTVGVGKKLAQNLYLHYSVGLFSPVSILNLRYEFSKHWAVQSETSTIDNGADLLYGFEHD